MSNCCSKKCFHCGHALPVKPTLVEIAGEKYRTCSLQCGTAVRNIAESGLMDFYRHRDNRTDLGANRSKPVENWATYERPAMLRQFVRDAANGDKVADLLIQGVHCAACTWLIENTLNRVAGVHSIEVNPVTTRAELRWDPSRVGLAELLQKIDCIGYTPIPFTEIATQRAAEKDKQSALRRLLVAGIGMMEVSSYAVAMYAGALQSMEPVFQEFFRLISLVVATPVVLYSGAPFFSGAWRTLKAGRMGMDVPVGLAIAAAWAASVWNSFAGTGEIYFDSATMFVFFLSGTRYLEAAGRYRSFDLTHALAQHIPSTAIRITQAGREEIGVLELEHGDTVLVAKGLAFPADGTLLDSAAQIDEAMLTGESSPVSRIAGDSIAAGTLNAGSEAVRIRVDKTGADTVLAQIGRLVSQAGNDRPELVQVTDRIAGVFTGGVLLIAAIAGAVWWQIDPASAFTVVLSVLVVSCPCALALATPAALTVATGALARRGFLIRRGSALQTLAKVNHVVFDKTGTLTENALEIERIVVDETIDAITAIGLGAALEANSAHPIARAFRSQSTIEPARDVRHVAGGGLEGTIDGTTYRIGAASFVGALASQQHSDLLLQDPEIRTVYLGDSSGYLARFEISEKLRRGAATLLRELHSQHIVTTIASGDRPEAVALLAEKIGAHNWHGGMLPEHKLALVQELQSSRAIVAAVGDGINDSPVLAGANVSIAMGNGTAVAQHSADCIWLGNQLAGLESAFTVARRAMRVVNQNLAWALVYNLTAIPLAISGMLAPWMAALGMSLSSLLVMANALRLSLDSSQLPRTTQNATSGQVTATPELAL